MPEHARNAVVRRARGEVAKFDFARLVLHRGWREPFTAVADCHSRDGNGDRIRSGVTL